VLAYEGFEVDVADDTDSALRLLGTKVYDAVVADLYLYSTDDELLLRRLRRESANLPVVVLTSWTTEAHRRLALAEDADDFLPLPTRPHELVDAVVAVLDKRRRQTPPSTVPVQDDRTSQHEI
ncbi:MAG TPA: response regulator, partial [Gemmatimonadaceae bacterium]|nr:response regulator [Gemmatimonadaceae bacterium]